MEEGGGGAADKRGGDGEREMNMKEKLPGRAGDAFECAAWRRVRNTAAPGFHDGLK